MGMLQASEVTLICLLCVTHTAKMSYQCGTVLLRHSLWPGGPIHHRQSCRYRL